MSSGLGIRPGVPTIRDWARCVWCGHGFSTHNSMLYCCVQGCSCKYLEMPGDLLDQHTMEVCV